MIYVFELFVLWIFALFFLHSTQFGYYNRRKFFVAASLTMMTLVLGFRGPNVGEDTLHYWDIFEQSVNITWTQVFTQLRITWRVIGDFQDKLENGFLFLNKLIDIFTDSPQVLLFLVGALTLASYGKFILDNSEDVFFSVYVLMCECMYMSMFNGIRQHLAIAIGINIYTYARKKQWKKAILVGLLACLIHNSAVVCFAILPVVWIAVKWPRKTRTWFVCILAACVALPLVLPLLRIIIVRFIPRYDGYFQNNYWQQTLGGTAVLWAIEAVLVSILWLSKFKRRESFSLSVFTTVYLSLELMAFSMSALGRVAMYFRAFLVLFFPHAVNGMSPRNKKIIKYGLLFILSVAFLRYGRVPSRNYTFFWS